MAVVVSRNESSDRLLGAVNDLSYLSNSLGPPQSAENVSARRVASSRYLLTLNAALVALYGLQSAGFGETHLTLLVPFAGIAVSVVWWQIIQSHRNLNDIKFGLILEIEKLLPAALYRAEWELAEKGQGKTYRAVTTMERLIPILFRALHAILTVIIILEINGILDWVK